MAVIATLKYLRL